jgi:NAD(P)-dependent dehydrogenase (short-subunit alcohol dehydrogenase family)
MTMELSGTSALVTGATSGIGKATATALAEHGARVVLSGRDQVRGKQVVKEIRAAGGEAYFVRAELHDEASARALAAQAKELAGPIDVLVNNAGIYPSGPTEHTTEQDFDTVYDLNVKVPFSSSPHWRRRWPSAAAGQSSTSRQWSRSSAWQAWHCTDRARQHWSC